MTSKRTKSKTAAKVSGGDTAEAAVAASNALVEDVVKTGAETASKQIDQAVTVAKEQADKAQKAQKAALKGYDDLVSLQNDNFAAMIKSGNVAVEGYEVIGKEMMSLAQSALEANLAATQALMGAKTLREALELQRSHLRDSLDQAVTGSSKLGELSVKVTSDAMAPLQASLNETLQRLMTPRAA